MAAAFWFAAALLATSPLASAQGRGPGPRGGGPFASPFRGPSNVLQRSPPVSASRGGEALIVTDFGAVGDGHTDDTAAFQAALQAASVNGSIVFAPGGQYHIASGLSIPPTVTLEGTYRTVPSHAVGQGQPGPTTGSVILATAGRGSSDGEPLITVGQDSTIRGFTVLYPDQKGDEAPVPYPWTVLLTGANAAVQDMELLNCWNCINATRAARHYIARVQGQPINVGVYVDETYDIGRVEDVHFNPWYAQSKTFMAHQLLHGRAFVFARTDWEYVWNTFAFAYAIGYHFIASDAGVCNGNFLGIGADMVANASVQVEAADPSGILITNGEFTSFVNPQFGHTDADSTQVVVSASNSGGVRFSNSAFWGPSNQIARVAGSGTVGFNGCTFSQWDAQKEGRPALSFGGSTNALVNGNDFQQTGAKIEFDSGVRKAVVVGNLFTGKQDIINNAKNVQISANAADE